VERAVPCASPAVVPLKRSWAASEAELLAAVVAGRPPAIAELFDRYSRLVRQMLIRTLGDSFDVDDLMQETFLTAVRRASTLRDPDALSSFIVGVAIRQAKNELRRRTVRRWIGLAHDGHVCDRRASRGLADTESDVSGSDPVAREGIRHLNRALEQLDPSSRVLFVLRHVEELELSEIARAESVSLATLKRRLARVERRFEAIAERDPVLRDYLVRPA
jgi:RNA polymerase sigma-70 factor, ECF subfamily